MAAVIIDQVVEALLSIGMQLIHAIFIGNKQNDIYLESIGIILIHIFFAIDISNTLIAKFIFRNAKLPIHICIRGCEKVMHIVVVNCFPERIKNLCCQLELLDL